MLLKLGQIGAVAASLLAGAVQAQPAAPYTFDIPKAYPLAAAKWRDELPLELRTLPWLANFQGVSGTVQGVVVDGSAMLYASDCKPHDCDRNSLSLRISADQSRIVGVAQLTTEGKTTPAGKYVRYTSMLLVGEPTNREVACLSRFANLRGTWSNQDRQCP